jgi:hypothetical protein
MLSELLGRIFAPSQVGLRGMKVLAPSNSAEKVTSNNLESDNTMPCGRAGSLPQLPDADHIREAIADRLNPFSMARDAALDAAA